MAITQPPAQLDVQTLVQPAKQVPVQLPVQPKPHMPVQADIHVPEQLPVQLPEQLPEQVNTQPAARTAFGLIMLKPKKAAADPVRAFFEESSRNLRRVTFLFSSPMIISFTLGS
jgi:hypothetical protein